MALLHAQRPKFRAEGSENKDGGQIVITNGRIVGFSGDFGLRVYQSFHTMGYPITRKAPVSSSSSAPDMQYRTSPSPVV